MSRVFDIEDAHIVSSGDDRSVVCFWHKFDREDVITVASQNGCGEAELRGRRLGLVRVNIDPVVVGTGGQQSAG